MRIGSLLRTVAKTLRTSVFALALLSAAVVVVSIRAADGCESSPTKVEFTDRDGNFLIRITFPDGEVKGCEAGFQIPGVEREFVKILCQRPAPTVGRVNARIEVEGASEKEWRFYKRDNMWDAGPQARTTIKDWGAPAQDYRMLMLQNQTRESGCFYFIRFDSPPHGEALVAFLLVPLEVEKEGDCESQCASRFEHGTWDKKSEYPDCGCICKKGWQLSGQAGVTPCRPCVDICKEKGGEHYLYDDKSSVDNVCECKCKDGYEYDSAHKLCKEVQCPDHATNVASLPVGQTCPKKRIFDRHCCCDAGYVRWGGICIREEELPGKGKVQKTAIQEERERLAKRYPGLKKGHVLYRQGHASAYYIYPGDDWGHVGLYIGDFEVTREGGYEVRDVEELRVFRDGKPIYLKKGERLKKGDVIVGAVVEMLESGAVFNTVEGFESMRVVQLWPQEQKDMEWRTTPKPPSEADAEKICSTAVGKVDKTEQGQLGYWLGAKGWTRFGKERFDCVNLVEHCYEQVRLNPTPDNLEGGPWSPWYLRPQEQYNHMVAPRAQPSRVGISVKSPVNLHLYDTLGRHVGVNPQGIVERQIPNVYYQPEAEDYPQGIVVASVQDDYQLVVDALDEGSFDLHIVDHNVSTPGSTVEIDFLDVHITKGTEASLNIGSVGNQYPMSVDEDGDGSVDQIVIPTAFGIWSSTEPSPQAVAAGDGNSDGLCTEIDALMALQMAVGLTMPDVGRMDVNGDGAVTEVDALQILWWAVAGGQCG